ncbi:tRNA pseudouridine synthase A [Syntrophobotulus glycolicus DSM 8271]|uniref:tRNA pseudouridine synthase A n=1 Tax=Syntrophobotulus glycolicus (strain DSM 8271 / FlGlyR) TaxID=645991 RepID=F0SY37_SYNGF|nr:tRNA pseudouridine(38-40) synthase TruA [Syntrophobotulus glycolicus]ADY54787.1 tRNA pseudouridine synthase A [Syntrophobotulus glycolicus DSM 8271]
MNNICLRLAYDGTQYHGFQSQPEEHGKTIQGELEKAWKRLAQEEIKIVTAGRTDKGVHAAGQVINFKSAARIPQDKIPIAMNSVLPEEIRILEAKLVGAEFNARTSAYWKRYDYKIENKRTADVFTRLYSLHEPVPLDLNKMRQAAARIEGKHDFKTFSAAGSNAKSFVRTVYHCKVQSSSGYITVTCIGNGFLYNMVRIITGTLLYVGKGKIVPEDMPGILKSRNRALAGKTVSPAGLVLRYIDYDGNRPSSIFEDIESNDLEDLI